MKVLQGGHQDRQRSRARDRRVRLPAAPVLPCSGEPPHLQCCVISQAHQHSHPGHLLFNLKRKIIMAVAVCDSARFTWQRRESERSRVYIDL